MSELKPILIATRGSALALAQSNTVKARCEAAFPGQRFELRIIKTTGDKLQTASLASSELPKGLFTKEIEEALVRNEGDLAVHSLKDLPTELPGGLSLGAVLEREDVRDVLVAKRQAENARGFDLLPKQATVASSSTRRRAQLLDARPDLNIVQIRGNVGTRLRKLSEQPELSATILAAAGLKRLQFKLGSDGKLTGPAGTEVPENIVVSPLEPEQMLPCVGQAAIGIEVRANDPRTAPLCAALNHPETLSCVIAERAFLSAMGGGCQLAVAAYARIMDGHLWMRAVSFLGEKPVRGEIRGVTADGEKMGWQLAAELTGRKS